MKSKLIGIFICMLLIGTVLPVTGTLILDTTTSSNKSGKTLYVGGSGEGNYTYIQDAVNDAVDGDTVFVYSGTYVEHLEIDKSIQLIGEDKHTTIIQSDMYSRHVVNCDSTNSITIKGFTLCNGRHGVNFRHSSNNIVDDNIIKDCEGPGIFIYGSNDNNNNIISNNLVMNCSSGVHIGRSSDNTISYNIFKSNTVWGIYIAGGTKHNTFHNNQIFDNEHFAIEFRYTVEDNTFFENTLYGKFSTYFGEVNNNLFYHNNFFCSFNGLGDINNWDNGEEGNYWKDNRGIDRDGDGIGDTPYPSKEYDKYPLMKAFGIESTPPYKPILDGPMNGTVREVYKYTAVTTDPDGDTIRYLFDWDDKYPLEWTELYKSSEEVVGWKIWGKEGYYNVRVKAKDFYGFESEWSDPLPVHMPRNRLLYNTLFLQFLEQFPILQKILGFIL